MTTCPISKDRIDERVPRVNGLISLVFMISGYFFNILWILMTIDFFLRGFAIKYSPIANSSRWILNRFDLEPIPIDAAPKKFAVRLGFILTLIMNIAIYSNVTTIAIGIFYMTIAAIGMETFLNFCIGCQMYTILIKLKLIKPKLNDIDFSALK